MNTIKHAIIGAVALLSVGIFAGCTLDRIDAGNVGVKVKLAGSDRGVQDMQLKMGWVFYNPFTEKVIEFPVSVQNIIWTKDPHEGLGPGEKPNTAIDESITFSSVEGVNANADVGFSFHINPDQAPKLYAKFRQTDMHNLAYGYMRNVVRQSFNDVASKMPIQEIYGPGKSKMESDVLAKCRSVLGQDGIEVDQLTINGALRLPQNVAEAINNAMAATQNAIQSENKVRQVKAEAEQAVEVANGKAESARKEAQGQADALLIRTEAEAKARLLAANADAKANQTVNSTLTPQVLQYKSVNQWNGQLPTYMGSGAVPMIPVK
jgi:regulator of protease activity HflC (stomatin/prohibitin superfamily)